MRKHVFIDMDGTITSFGSDLGKIIMKDEEFTGDFFATREPCWVMIDSILEVFDSKEWEYHILSKSPNEDCTRGKNEWLDINFPVKRDNRHFIAPDEDKCTFIVDYCFENDINIYDCALVDDLHQNLIDCEKIHVDSWHPSKVLNDGGKRYK